MNILVDVGHPGHVHLLKNVIHILKKEGHRVWVTVKDIPVAKFLLEKEGIDYISLGKKADSLWGKAFSQLTYNYEVWKLVKKNKITLGIGSSITLAHVSKISRMKSIILDDDDDEVQPLFVRWGHPFADTILSPSALIGHRKSSKAIFYAGYHELGYLHPRRFIPQPAILGEIGIKEGTPFFIMRFNVFKAHHDVGAIGLSVEQKIRLVNLLQKYGKVFITTERDIEPELRDYQLLISPEKTHHLMYYAAMFLGDSQTMTSEAAVLGTPALRYNSFVGRISYLNEEEEKYELTYGFRPGCFEEMLNKIESLLQDSNLKKKWQSRQKRMLNDKIDVTGFLIWFIENYPRSVQVMKMNPHYQYSFK